MVITAITIGAVQAADALNTWKRVKKVPKEQRKAERAKINAEKKAERQKRAQELKSDNKRIKKIATVLDSDEFKNNVAPKFEKFCNEAFSTATKIQKKYPSIKKWFESRIDESDESTYCNLEVFNYWGPHDDNNEDDFADSSYKEYGNYLDECKKELTTLLQKYDIEKYYNIGFGDGDEGCVYIYLQITVK